MKKSKLITSDHKLVWLILIVLIASLGVHAQEDSIDDGSCNQRDEIPRYLALPDLVPITSDNAGDLAPLLALSCEYCGRLTGTSNGDHFVFNNDGELWYFSKEEDGFRFELLDSNYGFTSAFFLPDGFTLVTADRGTQEFLHVESASITMWDLTRRETTASWFVGLPTYHVFDIAFNPSDMSIVTLGYHAVQEWDLRGNPVDNYDIPVLDFGVLTTDGMRFIDATARTGRDTSEVQVWELENEQEIAAYTLENYTPPSQDIEPNVATLSDDNSLLFLSRTDISDLRIFDLNPLNQRVRLNGDFMSFDLALNSDDSLLANGGRNGDITIWDVSDLSRKEASGITQLTTLQKGEDPVHSLAFAYDDKVLISIQHGVFDFWGIPGSDDATVTCLYGE